MGSTTGIEWADRTWNPASGCTKVSSGCKNCYAEAQAERFAGGKAFPDGFGITLRHEKINEPLTYRKPAKIFVNSMSDLFHVDIPKKFRDSVFSTILGSVVYNNVKPHKYLILTKRASEMNAYFDRPSGEIIGDWTDQAQHAPKNEDLVFSELVGAWKEVWPLPNLWLGVSVETRSYLNRIELLKKTPARVRFVSLEPLLNNIDLEELTWALTGIDWVIIGGESGPKARPCMPEWIWNCVRAARAAGCAVFVKQMGTWWANSNKASDYKGGLIDEWPGYLRIREFPESDQRGLL